jgi:hypothetical protein
VNRLTRKLVSTALSSATGGQKGCSGCTIGDRSEERFAILQTGTKNREYLSVANVVTLQCARNLAMICKKVDKAHGAHVGRLKRWRWCNLL